MNKWIFLLLAAFLFLIASLLRFSNLNQPTQYLFDEDLYVYTASLIKQGNKQAFEWWHPPDTTMDSPYQYRSPAVEWLHPPLSKYAIASSMVIFGDQPWAWRLPSALAGVGLVLAIGWLAETLFDKKSITLLAMLIASIESFLVVQSRLASADIFVALFTTATLASFAQWQLRGWRWGLPLAGILAGLAMSSKWSGGLIILALVVLLIIDYLRKQNCRLSKKSGDNSRHAKPVSVSCHRSLFPIKKLIISLSTVIFIPTLVYIIAFLPSFSFGHTTAHIIELHRQAWLYHATNRSFHPNSSPAYLWLLNQKPVWYYFNEETGKSIKAQTSPIIFWGGTMALLLSVIIIIFSNQQSTVKSRPQSMFSRLFAISNQEKQSFFTLLVAFFALWLPWLFVSRPTFYYHFLPCVPILITLLTYWAVRPINLWLSYKSAEKKL